MSEATFKKSTAREYFESLIITVILALFGTTFIIQAFKIPTPSMEDNLLVGDHLLVNKFAFGAAGSLFDPVLPLREIHRGDVIVFRYPKDLTKHYVKRTIGLPGDRIKIVNNAVFVNGAPLPEPYKMHKSLPGTWVDPERNFPPKGRHDKTFRGCTGEDPEPYDQFVKGDELVVPPDHYFAMGDNRDNSCDSRVWGFVPRDFIVGKPLIIYWSYETGADDYRQTDVGNRVQQITDLVVNFFHKTRWSRTFKIIR